MRPRFNMTLIDGTELVMDGANGIYIHNRFVNYNINYNGTFFCYNDKDIIDSAFQDFMAGKFKEVEVVTKIEPDLTFVLMPKGAKVIRGLGEEFPKDCVYDYDSMRIEFDLCVDGAFGGSFYVMELSEDETKEFIEKWLDIDKKN